VLNKSTKSCEVRIGSSGFLCTTVQKEVHSMQINTVISHSDCTLLYGNWREPGMRRVIDQCTQWGIRKIHLRTFNREPALYRSRIDEIQHGFKDQSIPGYSDIVADWDYRTRGMLGSAADQARKQKIVPNRPIFGTWYLNL